MATLIDSCVEYKMMTPIHPNLDTRCTTVALTLLARHVHTPSSFNVSLDLTTTFHAPVPLYVAIGMSTHMQSRSDVSEWSAEVLASEL